jgi:hypothetical protein
MEKYPVLFYLALGSSRAYSIGISQVKLSTY